MPPTDRSFYLSAQFPNFIGDQIVACLVFCDCFSTSKIRIRLIASTWHKSSHAIREEKEKREERKSWRLIHFSGEVTDISNPSLPPLFFPSPSPFLFLLRRTKLLTRSQVARKLRLGDRSTDRSIGPLGIRRNRNCAGRILEWALRFDERRTRGELVDTVPSGTKRFSAAARYNSKRFHDRYPPR